MPKKVQVTLTGNESKRLIAKAAVLHPEVRGRLDNGHKLLLAGGTTVSALAEELGFGPMRISGRIDAQGTRSAQSITQAPHNLLIQKGRAINADKTIQAIVEELSSDDLIITGANAIDPSGRAALAFAALGGGSRGYALHSAYMQGIPMLVLSGLNKLIPDLGVAMAYSGRSGVEYSMGAAIGLYNIFGPVVTEIKSFELLFNVQAVVIAGSGIGSGEGIVAAVMSTADTQLMTIMANGMHDIYMNTLVPRYKLKDDEKRLKILSTVLTVVVLIGALLLSFKFNNIQKLLSKALSITTSACVVPYLGGRFMKKGTDIGALASMAVALTLLVLNFTGVIHLINDLIGLIPAAIVYVVVSLFTYKEDKAVA